MKKILLTGVNGQVGYALKTLFTKKPGLPLYEVIALSREHLDLTKTHDIKRIVREIKPDLIINPAAYTAVDNSELEPKLAYAVNATAPQILAEEAARLNAAMIHFSTDYVYDGCKTSAYVETDAVNPVNVYGQSKLAGEEAIRQVALPHLILRTSWVYGTYGKNFLKTLLRLAAEHNSLSMVDDQFGAPTSSECIAESVISIVDSWQYSLENQTGVYHLTNAGKTSWHGFACEIIHEYNQLTTEKSWPALKINIDAITAICTADYPTLAIRPTNSKLDNTKLKQTFAIALPSWQQGLQQAMQNLTL